jgi:addiction module HigA family antidote
MKMKPVHPGEVLLEDFLNPMGLSQYRLAKEIHVPLRRVNEIALGRRGISADTALRFARFFGTTPEVWQNLQSQYEMDVAKSSVWGRIVETVKPLRRTAACL